MQLLPAAVILHFPGRWSGWEQSASPFICLPDLSHLLSSAVLGSMSQCQSGKEQRSEGYAHALSSLQRQSCKQDDLVAPSAFLCFSGNGMKTRAQVLVWNRGVKEGTGRRTRDGQWQEANATFLTRWSLRSPPAQAVLYDSIFSSNSAVFFHDPPAQTRLIHTSLAA